MCPNIILTEGYEYGSFHFLEPSFLHNYTDSTVEIAGTFKISMDTSTKVYDAVMAGADMWAVISIIAAVTGPLAIGGAVVFYMIKRKIKGMARSAAIAW
ncbi:DNA processing Smf single strand binding protein-like protein [Paenibacillus larvae subsp. larvae DSM 25430]|nr:DNA processing Smf single strand binding protein-like protein [Paenibacillus larvae subsp. larvae DSM 25430]